MCVRGGVGGRVPVGPVCLRGLVLAGGRQSGSVLVRVRERVRVRVGGRVGGAGGALRGRVVGVGGRGAAVVQTVELIHLLICRLWTETDTEGQERDRQLCSVKMSRPLLLSDRPLYNCSSVSVVSGKSSLYLIISHVSFITTAETWLLLVEICSGDSKGRFTQNQK